MEEGYYWIKFSGLVQVAYYMDGLCEDLDTGKTHRGIWLLMRGDDISHNGEAEVISGPLQKPESAL